MTTHQNWENFINDNLLKKGLLNGACLLSAHGECLYSYGILTQAESDWNVFPGSFKDPKTVLLQGFLLEIGSTTIKYKVYKHTYCSMYATSEGGQDGLIVCNLPYGVLLCTYTKPQLTNVVVKQVEEFCDRLRA